MKEEAKNWIMQAEADLDKAKILFENNKFDGASFYAHQTIEKSLKAVIIIKTNNLVKIHDLFNLGKSANLPIELIEKIKNLSGLYIDSRYGIINDKIPAERYTKNDSKQFLLISEEVLEWCKKMI